MDIKGKIQIAKPLNFGMIKSPARCIKENVCRVWNNEDKLDAFFAENESCAQIND